MMKVYVIILGKRGENIMETKNGAVIVKSRRPKARKCTPKAAIESGAKKFVVYENGKVILVADESSKKIKPFSTDSLREIAVESQNSKVQLCINTRGMTRARLAGVAKAIKQHGIENNNVLLEMEF